MWSPVSAGGAPASFFLEGHTRTKVGTGAGVGARQGPPKGNLGVSWCCDPAGRGSQGGFSPPGKRGGSLVSLTDVHQHVPVGEGAAERRGAIILEEHSSQPNEQVNKIHKNMQHNRNPQARGLGRFQLIDERLRVNRPYPLPAHRDGKNAVGGAGQSRE